MTWMMAAVGACVFAVLRPEWARTVLAFIITLSVLVFVHEWGHYQFGRWGGMKINRFGIGFPPWIATKRYKGIDYSIGALPIGGMVDIAGLGSEEEMVATSKGEGIGVQAPRANVPHGEKRFQDATLGWRFMTLFAGPMMNFIFALVVFALMLSLVGVPQKVISTNTVDVVQPYTPAFRAGLQSEDKIVGVNTSRSSDPNALRKLIQASEGKPITLVIERDAQTLRLPITPQYEESDTVKNGKVVQERVPIIGVMFLEKTSDFKKLGLFKGETGFGDSAIGVGLMQSKMMAEGILSLIKRAFTLKLTESDKRNIGGPFKIAQVVGHTVRKSWQDWVILAGSLSVNLGLMNLLPIPALDGGRIMFILYEAVMRRPFDQRKEGLVNAVGMAMLLCFMLFMTFRDVLPWIQKSLQ